MDAASQQLTEEKRLLQMEMSKICVLKSLIITANRNAVEKFDKAHEVWVELDRLWIADRVAKKGAVLNTEEIPSAPPAIEIGDDDHREECQQNSILFPVEIFEKIFVHVTMPADFYNIQSSCRLFRNIVSPRRSTFLFHKVFPILRSLMRESGVLKCRLVARPWKYAIDNHLIIEFNPHMSETHGDVDPSPFLHAVRQCKFQNSFAGCAQPRILSGILAHEDLETANEPILGHAMKLKFNLSSTLQLNHRGRMDNRQQLFWSDLKDFFIRNGRHVSSLSIEIEDCYDLPSVGQFNNFFYVHLMSYVPNLKHLRITGSLPVCRPSQNYPLTQNNGNSPVLQSLELDLNVRWDRNDHHHTKSFILALAGSGASPENRVRRLLVDWNMWQNWELNRQDWTSLTQLCIVRIRQDIMPQDIMYSNLRNLVKLTLISLHNENGQRGCSFAKVIEIISHTYKNTELKSLVLNTGYDEPMAYIDVGLAPPTITSLEILENRSAHRVGPHSYAFVLHFIFIKKLRVTISNHNWDDQVNTYNDLHEGDILDLYKFLTGKRITCYSMGMWQLLSRLETFSVNQAVYSRSGYDRAIAI